MRPCGCLCDPLVFGHAYKQGVSALEWFAESERVWCTVANPFAASAG